MAADKPRGKCGACGKDPRVLHQIASGQMICQTCWREIHPPRPKHLATYKQIDYARALGLDFSDDATKEQVEPWLARAEAAIYYSHDVWESLTGKRPQDSGTTLDEFAAVVRAILGDEALSENIRRTEDQRIEEAYVASDEWREQQESENYRNVPTGPNGEWLSPTLTELKPPLRKDHSYRAVAKLLKSHLGHRM